MACTGSDIFLPGDLVRVVTTTNDFIAIFIQFNPVKLHVTVEIVNPITGSGGFTAPMVLRCDELMSITPA
ncbi:hypothetical protein [Ectobacillus funiculus]|uniref:hypothetical protein n=1 Tax=Ectobacillus funiculus TaxID=137993 RepID=UPI00101CD417|nr:hypothetical protein [Ectobacillus funiculus]